MARGLRLDVAAPRDAREAVADREHEVHGGSGEADAGFDAAPPGVLGGCARGHDAVDPSRAGSMLGMEGFGFFNDPDFQKRLGDMAEQMQSAQSLAWADNAIKLAVDLTVAAMSRINVQGTTEEQAEQLRATMVKVFTEAVTLVSEARRGLK
jgi:hypothetical protein